MLAVVGVAFTDPLVLLVVLLLVVLLVPVLEVLLPQEASTIPAASISKQSLIVIEPNCRIIDPPVYRAGMESRVRSGPATMLSA
ncbi:hypothetical protein A4R35_03925 [Thermogemmatispora tikiterensis]|uniref:Uncharacterized protein n=1 Tax=Thermogemmatispora tikiterensis TaxID=1825093 RepID=A0A328VFZ3_9CHLR|nr:hypothetical protein A4R35_03925 [Thermogemmatispora tikiterensis]